jgi:hypothetical protein
MLALAALFAVTLAIIGARLSMRPGPATRAEHVDLSEGSRSPTTPGPRAAAEQAAGAAAAVIARSFRTVSAASAELGDTADGAAVSTASLVQSPVIYAGSTVFSFTADFPAGARHEDLAVCNTRPLPRFDIDGLSLARRDAPRRPAADETAPDDEYGVVGAGRTAAVMYFFAPDSARSPARGGYVLWRQVNDAAPVALVRNVLPDSLPFFRYQYHVANGARADSLAEVPAALLPITATDTVSRAISAPSIRVVEIRFLVTNGLSGAARHTERIDLAAALPLARTPDIAACRGEPQLPPSLGA